MNFYSTQEKNKASIDKVVDQLKTHNRLLGNEEVVTNLEQNKSYININQILGSSSPACSITYKLDADGELTLISVSYVHLDTWTNNSRVSCILFDIKSICQNSRRSMDLLKPLLESGHLKMCHDVKDFGTILKSQFNITLSNVIDTQLVFECLAHGCLRGLVKNRQLNGLVGGVENVTIGDMEAANLQRSMGGEFSKVRQQRSGTPVFDVILELRPNKMDEWTIIKDVDKAVDKILAGKKYAAQVRRRNSSTGVMTVEMVQN